MDDCESRYGQRKENSEYNGASIKVLIDLRATRTTPVLESLVPMPSAPTPEEELAQCIGLPSVQRVDVMVLIKDISEARHQQTRFGNKQIVDACFVDGSRKKVDGDLANISMSLFLSDTASGTAELESLRAAMLEKKPVSLFGLTCAPDLAQGKVVFSTSQSFFWRLRRARVVSWSGCGQTWMRSLAEPQR